MIYSYSISGIGKGCQKWSVTGAIQSNPGNFIEVPQIVIKEAFGKLMQGATNGPCCGGPYKVTRLIIERGELE